jgi:uncharacterized protein (TIGR03089 family)
MTVPAPVAGSAATAADRPLLTYHDDATGEHVDLSAVALGGWAARTAALLHRGCGLGTGNRAAVLLPPHWQTAAVVLGAWSAGLTVAFRLAATAGLAEPDQDGFDVTFVARDRADSWLEDVPDAPYRFALGPGPSVDGYRDYLAEVNRYPDSLPSAYAPIHGGHAATADGTTYGQWGSLAHELAGGLDLHAGDRLLVDTAEHEHPVKWLLAPFSVGASVVLCANLDRAGLADRIAAEGVTRVL